MTANISIRESIRWLPDPASETTSTIVLTSPSCHFVDIRIFNDTDSANGIDTDGLRSVACIDWAMAGTSSYRKEQCEGRELVHAEWKHLVDSRHVHVENVIDRGEMTPLDDVRTLETGTMENPETGQMTAYEEIWVDAEVKRTEPNPIRCVTLVAYAEDGEVAGMVIRLGQYCQGVFRDATGFHAQRWEWIANVTGSQWKRTLNVGQADLPCEAAVHTLRWANSDCMRCGDCDWHVLEFEEW